MTTTVTDCRSLYAVSPDFRSLLGLWAEGKQCPLPLVDFLIEQGLPEAAEAARWAATKGLRQKAGVGGTGYPYPNSGRLFGTLPSDWYWYTQADWYSHDIEYLPSAMCEFHPTLTDALLWLLEKGKAEG